MAANCGTRIKTAVRYSARKMNQKLQDAKKGVRQMLSTMRNKFRLATVRNHGPWDYTRLEETKTSTHSEGPVRKEHVTRMMHEAFAKTEREIDELILLIRESYQVHLTGLTGDLTITCENSRTGAATIEQLTRMLDDLELKADELMYAFGMSNTD